MSSTNTTAPDSKSPITVAIDAFRLIAERKTSGANYVKELALGIAPDPRVKRVYMIFAEQPDDYVLNLFAGMDKISLIHADVALDPSSSWGRYIKWNQQVLPSMLKSVLDLSWFIAPYHQTPVMADSRIKVLTVVHDACGLKADCGYKKLGKGYWKHRLNFFTAMHRADRIVPISKYTYTDFLRYYPTSISKLTKPIINAVSNARLSAESIRNEMQSMQTPENGFFIAFAAPGPRKGTDITLQAYKHYKALGGKLGMVFIGSRSGLSQWQTYAASIEAPEATWLSGISDNCRDALYAESAALVFPSRCEGFGYPIVEAMRQGGLVIAHRESPASEIIEETAPLLGSLDTTEIASMMSYYEKLSDASRKQASDVAYQQSMKFASQDFGRQFVDAMLGMHHD